jgi:hypothetical protein
MWIRPTRNDVMTTFEQQTIEQLRLIWPHLTEQQKVSLIKHVFSEGVISDKNNEKTTPTKEK